MFLNSRLRFRTFSSLLLRISIVVALSIGLLGGLSNSSLLQSSQLVSVGAVLFATADGAGSGPCTSIFTPSTADCSLSTALGQAVPGDTIELLTPGTASVYSGNFTIATPSTSSTEQVTIRPATGVTNPILDGGQNGTVVTVNNGVFATIDGVTIQNGKENGGGGIKNSGTLTATNDTISRNTGLYGGGINNGGTLTVTNDTISDNTIDGAVGAGIGGGISNGGLGRVTANNDTISGNSAPTTYGGGIGNYGTFNATNDTISRNTGLDGGGIFNGGNLMSTNDTISNNTTVLGSRGYIGAIGGNGGGINNSGILAATNDTISNNTTGNGNGGNGGSGGNGGNGGGINNSSTGILDLTNDTISNNTTGNGGGGAVKGDGGNGGNGGGVNNFGTLLSISDTIANNKVGTGGKGGQGAIGGQDGTGGGISNGGTLTAASDTITRNTASQGGGIFNNFVVSIGASIVADQTSGGDCYNSGALIASFGYNVTDDTSCGFSSGTGDVVALPTLSTPSPADLLGPLANNGGLTLTIAPEHGNPAIGLIPTSYPGVSGPNAVVVDGTNIELCPTTDQRGIASASGHPCNAGSVQGSPQQITFAPPSAGTVGSSANLSATGGNSNNPVIFSVDPSSTPGACSITANTVTFTGSGSCVIDANQQGDQSYLAAPTVQKTITVQMAPSIPLAVPASPTVNGPSSVSSNSVTITWTPSTNPGYSPATSYEVFEGTAPNKESNTPVTCSTPLTSSSTSCTITGLNPSTTYYFYVVATDTAGSSTASNEISITTSTTTTTPQSPSKISTPGYLLAGSDGGVFTYGSANFYGSTANMTLNKPIVGVASTPDGKGYWLAASDGGVFAFGDANYYGSTVDKSLNKPIVGIASTTDGKGYWLAASDGGVFAFGDANYYGSTANMTLNKPIAGITATSDGKGYWLVAADGGVFSFGDATYLGSAADLKLKRAVDSVASVAVAG